MTDYKVEAAKAALQLIKPNQTIGLGAGTTVSHLVSMISQKSELWPSLIFTSSSFKTTALLQEQGLRVQSPSLLSYLDIYFDGCDQFDSQLNALKSGGGIHTTEKILASMAKEFILIGDEGKFVQELGTKYPLVIEILPQALQVVLSRLNSDFPDAQIKLRMSNQKDGAVISENGNLLADIYFAKAFEPQKINIWIKMIPGIVDHSLFYRMASKALIAGEKGISVITPV
ncbi:MAG TPA: ribose 5-phosphate isomerase A [Mucilaginibacter sp.]|jgi:ribose 5-phosphate isomerase A